MDFNYEISELMAFSVALKVQELSQMTADLATTTQQMSATTEETSENM